MSARMFATFFIDETLWGVNVLQVREVLRKAVTSPVPHTAPYILGLMNLRGQIVTVIDLARRLGCDGATEDGDDMCVVLKSSSELSAVVWADQDLEDTGPDSVGLLVQRMGRVVEVDSDAIRSPPANVDPNLLPFIRGVVPLEEELLLVLTLDQVLDC